MKKSIVPFALTLMLLSGCAAPWHSQAGQKAHAEEQTPRKTIGPNGNATDQTPATSHKPAYIRLPNDQIDFNKLLIECDVSKQMIYVKQGDKIVRSFPTSSGLDTDPDNSTPLGVYTIQPEKGTWFYSEQYQEGAKYWVSWKDHGVFLFHSVVMDKNGNIKQDELQKLGSKASHGCFRIPLEDAKWIYDNIKVGTKVWVHA